MYNLFPSSYYRQFKSWYLYIAKNTGKWGDTKWFDNFKFVVDRNPPPRTLIRTISEYLEEGEGIEVTVEGAVGDMERGELPKEWQPE